MAFDPFDAVGDHLLDSAHEGGLGAVDKARGDGPKRLRRKSVADLIEAAVYFAVGLDPLWYES